MNDKSDLQLVDCAVPDRRQPDGNQAAWDEFSRWIAQSSGRKTRADTADGSVRKSPASDMPVQASTLNRSQQQSSHDRGRVVKTNLTDHQLGGNRSSNGRTRSLLFWVPVLLVVLWVWFGRG